MKTLAFLLRPQTHFEPNDDFLIAGVVALLVASTLWLFRKKKALNRQSYSFWLFLGAGMALVIVGFICGSQVESEAIIEAAR